MYNAHEFAGWIGRRDTPPTPKNRRNLPPDLLHAIDHERTSWVLFIKGLCVNSVIFVPHPRGRKLAWADSPACVINSTIAALQQIEIRNPKPALLPATPEARKRCLELERWFCGEVAPTILWLMVQPQHPASNTRGMLAPAMQALETIGNLTKQQTYLVGESLTRADIAAASVLAPLARKEGWVWAGRNTGLGRSSRLLEHPSADWVRQVYAKHAPAKIVGSESGRAWLP